MLDVAASSNIDVDDMGFVICDIMVREAIAALTVGCTEYGL